MVEGILLSIITLCGGNLACIESLRDMKPANVEQTINARKKYDEIDHLYQELSSKCSNNYLGGTQFDYRTQRMEPNLGPGAYERNGEGQARALQECRDKINKRIDTVRKRKL